MQATAPSHEDNIVWNRIIRAIHWGVVVCVVLNLVNDGDGVRLLHNIVGYVAAALVILRICYGLFSKSEGSYYAQFTNWHLGPKKVTAFISDELKNKSASYTGHNPLASWTYLVIWLVILSLGVTGFMMSLDAFFGEDWVEELHEILSNGLIVLFLLHMAGMLKDAIRKKEPTWMKIIKGKL
jgi:cytochrome b